jgi:hypothetical protein
MGRRFSNPLPLTGHGDEASCQCPPGGGWSYAEGKRVAQGATIADTRLGLGPKKSGRPLKFSQLIGIKRTNHIKPGTVLKFFEGHDFKASTG